MGSGTINDLSIYKHQQVLVYKPDGVTFLGAWPDAPLLAGFKESINSATTPLRVDLPRTFDNFDQVGGVNSKGTVAQGNVVQYWLFGPGLPASGKLRYQGVIDTYEPQIKDNGEETVTVTITPFDSVLGDHGIMGPQSFGTSGTTSTYLDPLTMFNWFFTNNDSITGNPYMYPLTADGSNPSSSGNAAQYTFQRQTMLDVMTTIVLMCPANWYFCTTPSKTVKINVAASTAQHILYIGQNIASFLYSQDWMGLRNVITIKGGINTGSGLQIYTTVQGSDLSTFGERLLMVEDTRIVDSNTATAIANGYLNQYDKGVLRAKVRVPDYRGASGGMGYDIESLAVGDTVIIVDPLAPAGTQQTLWDSAVWDTSYWDASPGTAINRVIQIVGLTYNFDYVDLELSALQPSQDRALYDIMRRYQKFALT